MWFNRGEKSCRARRPGAPLRGRGEDNGGVPDVSALFPDLYRPDPVGRAAASALASQQVIRLFGNLVLCGRRYFDDDEVGEVGEVGLSEVQQEAIRGAHAAVVAVGSVTAGGASGEGADRSGE